MRAVVIRGGRVWAPEPRGVQDILAVGERIAAVGPALDPPPWANPVVAVDAREADVLPGLVDQHVHIAGGGGEGGPGSDTPPVRLTDLTTAGVTTVVGLLGTDGTTRSVQGLLARARSLVAEGLTAYIYTGAYEVPTRTITGSARADLVLIDRVIGVGEIAVSDPRGTHPSARELARLAAEAHVGGLLGGKAGVLHVHLGDGIRRLKTLWTLRRLATVPVQTLVPTHLNRHRELLADAAAWGAAGGWVDLTTDIRPDGPGARAVAAHEAALWLAEQGVPWDHITFSSDGQGSAPVFDPAGRVLGLGIGRTASLFEEVLALRAAGLTWERAVAPATLHPARRLGLDDVGRIAPGCQADLLVVGADGRLRTVIARGRVMVDEGRPVRFGRFDAPGS
ncbi:MAG: beta-aspartyl-peptidase [Actinomycetia bacterium]|nr:beta-aspartyl-peptidase [Actinomycetes bacterium]